MTNIEEWKRVLDSLEQIYIFGNGTVAKRLRNLIDHYGDIAKFAGYIVSNEPYIKDERLEFVLDAIPDFDKKNTGVLMSVTESYHPDIYNKLRDRFDYVIEGVKFFSLELPIDSRPFRDIFDETVVLSQSKMEAREQIIDMYFQKQHAFGVNTFYQSFPSLGILGDRPTDYRIRQYGVYEYLSNEKKVLDIGCNCGFFDMEIASKAKEIIGLEYDESMSLFSKQTAEILNISNVQFVSGDFNKWYPDNRLRFDIIFSFAVHIWIGMSPKKYASAISKMITDDGILIFESQDYANDVKYLDFCHEFENQGFEIIKDGMMQDDGQTERRFTVFAVNKGS